MMDSKSGCLQIQRNQFLGDIQDIFFLENSRRFSHDKPYNINAGEICNAHHCAIDPAY